MAQQHQPENIWTVSLLAIQPTDRILEVGFGPGVAIELMAAQATKGLIAGVDFSPAMLALARRRNAQAIKAGRVDLHLGEVTFLSKDRWPGIKTAATISGVYTGQEVVQLMYQAGFSKAHIEEGPQQKPFREIAVVAVPSHA